MWKQSCGFSRKLKTEGYICCFSGHQLCRWTAGPSQQLHQLNFLKRSFNGSFATGFQFSTQLCCLNPWPFFFISSLPTMTVKCDMHLFVQLKPFLEVLPKTKLQINTSFIFSLDVRKTTEAWTTFHCIATSMFSICFDWWLYCRLTLS